MPEFLSSRWVLSSDARLADIVVTLPQAEALAQLDMHVRFAALVRTSYSSAMKFFTGN
jgi:hypothetical protein